MDGGDEEGVEEAQGTSELDVLEDVHKEFQSSDSIRDDILIMVALSERETGQKRFEQITGRSEGPVKMRLLSAKMRWSSHAGKLHRL